MQRRSTLQLTLSSTARLAKVQRAVVSMWRNRPVEGQPFPEPVAVIGGQERFDAFEVADYLARTGRGNNRDAHADLAAHASFEAPSDLGEEMLFDGLTALLCLASAESEPLSDSDAAELVSRARDLDPDDSVVQREISALGMHATDVAARAEDLADAAFSAKAAFEAILRDRLHHGLAGHSAVALHADVVSVIAQVATALANDAGWETPVFVDVTDGSAELLLAVVAASQADTAPSVGTVTHDTVTARLARRRLRTHDVHRVDIAVDEESHDITVPSGFDGAVHVLQLPAPSDPSLSDAELLDVVGDLEVQLADDARAVVLGPASALVDKPRSADVDRARDAILRGGRLRAAIRLPKGLMVRSPRRALALWVLGPAHPDVPIAERATVVGDLSHEAVTPDIAADLVSDVLTATTSPRMASRRALRFARLVPTSALVVGRRALIAGPVDHRGGERRTLAALVASRQCRAVSGSRIRSEDLVTSGRRVVGTAELLGELPLGGRCVDPVVFPTAYPRAQYTEPGDVVFCTSPRIAAWTDRDGGSVVLSPARVLRVVDDPERGRAPLLPDVVAADINAVATASRAQPLADTRDWRRWSIRLVPRQQLDPLADALADIRARRGDLVAELTELDRQSEAVIARYTNLTDPTDTREGDS